MATAPSLISLDEYMQTSDSPDCEYIDGAVVERNVGQGKHAYTQGKIYLKLGEGRLAGLECFSRAACQGGGNPSTHPGCLRGWATRRELMGVPCIWVIDPYASRAWIFEDENPPIKVHDGRLVADRLGIQLQLADVLPTSL